MYLKLIVIPLILLFTITAIAQNSVNIFDTVRFNKNLELANRMVEYDFYNQLSLNKMGKEMDISKDEWFSYPESKTWHTVGGSMKGNNFVINKHETVDSNLTISDYSGSIDTGRLNAYGRALSLAEKQFQTVRDTSSMYFSSFVLRNEDQTISIWFLPAFQPSGQGIYGCEWEYLFDKYGLVLLEQKSFVNVVTGVWIGQPRELWLNYRNADAPTVGSLFFAQSFRDYFTRIRIDTKISTSTTYKDNSGNYLWNHKIK
jgi:hypothetical protein